MQRPLGTSSEEIVEETSIRSDILPVMERTEDLKAAIKRIPGVLESAIFPDHAGHPIEIQVWIRADASERGIRLDISKTLTEFGQLQENERIYVFELTSTSPDPKKARPVGRIQDMPPRAEVTTTQGAATEEAATESIPEQPVTGEPILPQKEAKRAKIGKISLSSSTSAAHADVSLIVDRREAAATGEGPRTPYALRVTAATTLESVHALMGIDGGFELVGVSLIEVMEERMVVVVVESHLRGGGKLLGSTLVGDLQVYEATVKATLDAVNRQLSSHL